jgi:hypothetical protein
MDTGRQTDRVTIFYRIDLIITTNLEIPEHGIGRNSKRLHWPQGGRCWLVQRSAKMRSGYDDLQYSLSCLLGVIPVRQE